MSLLLGLMLSISFGVAAPARADIAPPDSPPGTNPVPGSPTTRVRMVAERVILDVQERSPGNSLGQAKVTAVFTMRNLGSQEERMEVRFPLSYWDANSGGGHHSEITDLQVKVDAKSAPTRRVIMQAEGGGSSTPWTVFEAVFPVERDVIIEVTYTAEGFGDYPYLSFRYILETGAGWMDTIGTADLVVRLPYEANRLNVIFDEHLGWSQTTPGGEFAGREIHWRFVDLEPGRGDNFELSLVTPSAWKKVITERETVAKSPGDGEAWGRLGKAYKEIARLRRGLRQDEGGLELFRLSLEAYRKSLDLLPGDSLWRFGYAELLWEHYYWNIYMRNDPDVSSLVEAVDQLRMAVELDSNNRRALDLLEEIGWSFPWAVERVGAGFTYPILTATPTLAPTDIVPILITDSPAPSPTRKPTATQIAPVVQPADTLAPAITQSNGPVVEAESNTDAKESSQNGLPFCGGGFFIPLLVLAILRKCKPSQ